MDKPKMIAIEKFNNAADHNRFVNTLLNFILDKRFTTLEVKDAAALAVCLYYERRVNKSEQTL